MWETKAAVPWLLTTRRNWFLEGWEENINVYSTERKAGARADDVTCSCMTQGVFLYNCKFTRQWVKLYSRFELVSTWSLESRAILVGNSAGPLPHQTLFGWQDRSSLMKRGITISWAPQDFWYRPGPKGTPWLDGHLIGLVEPRMSRFYMTS